MRINRFIALATGVSRRAADTLADAGEILVNGRKIRVGQEVTEADRVTWRGKRLKLPEEFQTILLNKPVRYVSSRSGQGSNTIYELLPAIYHELKPVGRLDKNSSGLLLLTNDGVLAHQLSHPSSHKMKCYEIILDKPLKSPDWFQITKHGVLLDDGISKFDLQWQGKDGKHWKATLYEGRNRQIRRTFAKQGYEVTKLHRTIFGDYVLGGLPSGKYKIV